MSTTYIPAELRRLVVARSDGLCEYCLITEDDAFYGCEADHIISEKHGGLTLEDNLANACFRCNRGKGSDVGSIYWESGEFVRFFNPRTDRWSDHFQLVDAEIVGLTPIGKVTARILNFNRRGPLMLRKELLAMKCYPST